MVQDEKEEKKIDKAEREAILDYLRMQNEALKRVFKKTLEKEENEK